MLFRNVDKGNLRLQNGEIFGQDEVKEKMQRGEKGGIASLFFILQIFQALCRQASKD